MRLATYNIWNSDVGMPARTDDLVSVLTVLQADVLCLQEVRDNEYHNLLVSSMDYPYHTFCAHEGEAEGLSVLSHFPIETQICLQYGIVVKIVVNSVSLLVANIHLPWDSVLKREKASIHLHDTLCDIPADFRLITGDFNSAEKSSVQQFLLGEASLLGKEAFPCWFDLAEGFACRRNTTADATLNFCKNPRWQSEETVEVNQRLDRILLQNPYPNPFPKLENVGIFGTEASPKTGFAPSDHYGVYADLIMK